MASQDEASRTDWLSPEKAALIRRTCCPAAVTDDEFALFLEQCRRSGLSPVLKECFCVPRRENKGSRDHPVWHTRHEFQPSEAGMLARAERFPDCRGIQASAVYAEDEILVDQGVGEVRHRFNPAQRKGKLVGAWARVVRENKLPVVVWLEKDGYAQNTPLWSKIPGTMIEKCARVAALRKAYPEAFGGLYIREEMPEDDGGPELTPSQGRSARVSSASSSSRPAALSETQSKGTPTPVKVSFGQHKGRQVSELTDEELAATLAAGSEKLAANATEEWAPALARNLKQLESEKNRRHPPAPKSTSELPEGGTEAGQVAGTSEGTPAPAIAPPHSSSPPPTSSATLEQTQGSGVRRGRGSATSATSAQRATPPAGGERVQQGQQQPTTPGGQQNSSSASQGRRGA